MEICLIDAEGLDEEIRCEMCRNPMRSDTGCDGGCAYDEKLYEKIVHLLNERIKPLPNIKPERKTGRWIGNPETCEFMTCSACGCEFDWVSEGGYPSNEWAYCPECGAFMGGELESER